MSFQVFTLVSGSYVHAAAALVNSLQMCGFDGEIFVGHSGELNWKVSTSARITTINVDHMLTKWIGNLKPLFLSRYAQGPFAFIDADCIVGSAKLLEIVEMTIRKCPLISIEALLPGTDHRRLTWRCSGLESQGLGCDSNLGRSGAGDHYYNSGFICGNTIRDAKLLYDWANLNERLEGLGHLDEDSRFRMADQDCLNAIVQDCSDPVATLCPPDVWYAGSPSHSFLHLGSSDEPLLIHCTGRDKPWLRCRVPARPPNIYERQWFSLITRSDSWARSELVIPRPVRSWLAGTFEGRLRQAGAKIVSRLAARF
jgi:hypothetical protein